MKKSMKLIVIAASAAFTMAGSSNADTISQSAAVYATYQADVSDVKNKPLSSTGDIDSALTNLGGQNADKLAKGWISYSALVASQNSEYRAAVRDIESFYGRQAIVDGLKNDARYARTLNGGRSAVSSALTASSADSRRLSSAAAIIKEQAYSLQGAGWAKAKIKNSGARADRLSSASMAGRPASSNLVSAFNASDINSTLAKAGRSGAPSLWDGVSSAASAIRFPSVSSSSYGSSKSVRSGKESVADQIATLAAYRVLGADSSNASQIAGAMHEQQTSNCVKMAQLNLQQCVAAAHQQYEVPFCIGEHAMAEIGKCIGNVSN